MALITIVINDPGLNRKSAEAAFCQYAVGEALKEMARARGTIASGNIIGVSTAGVANTPLGTWTMISTATGP